MTSTSSTGSLPPELILPAESAVPSRPIWAIRPSGLEEWLKSLPPHQAAWLKSTGFKATARKHALLPGADGAIAGAVLGLGEKETTGAEPSSAFFGLLPTVLPAGVYHLAGPPPDPELAAVAWGLGGYRFRRYKSSEGDPLPRLKLPAGVDHKRIAATIKAVSLGRDLINTPANDMGPEELEKAARTLGAEFSAPVASIIGNDLLARNFPLIHAVGRASPRAPRLIDLVAEKKGAPKVTIVGKGICFDTGGLDLKPSSAMLLMKKDMGGAATAIALSQMILASGLNVSLRLLIPAAENSVAGNAFRPSDVIKSRAGKTVEIGNTDAEGRLVLADALALADEDKPDRIITFATLTGAARVAVGPDIAPYFTDDDDAARLLDASAAAVGDAVWRMPLSTPYESWLDSSVADMNNVAEGGFGGAIVGAMFLKRFVTRARSFMHFDIYGWRTTQKAFGPKGGETNAARAVFEMLRRQYGG